MTKRIIIVLACLLASSIGLNLYYERKIKVYDEVMHSRRYNAFFWREQYETLLFDYGLLQNKRHWDSCYRDMVTPKVIGNSWPDSPRVLSLDTSRSKPVWVPKGPDTPGDKVYTKGGRQ